MTDTDLQQLAVNTIRMLSADMVQQANSGHPGMPMGAAPMAHVLWTRIMRYDPADPSWADRDRFVLSAGHGSALLYSMLHLTGYDLPMEELRDFRQWGSKTPGHPEVGDTPGVECTTGPLGQGLSMAAGMALAERVLADRFNGGGPEIVGHYTYVIVGDGCMMEGITHEASSFAGTHGLGRLIVLYDDNHISIEGGTELTFTEDVRARYRAYGWQVLEVADGTDLDAIEAAVRQAQGDLLRPSLICVRTHIGHGSPRQDMSKAHGEPLGDTMAETRRNLGWPEQTFHVPAEVAEHMHQAGARAAGAHEEWTARFEAYRNARPQDASTFQAWINGELPAGWDADLPVFAPDDGPLATRAASGKALNALALTVPNLLGGSADLAPSNKTVIDGTRDLRPDKGIYGRNIRFGVREFAMAAIVIGMAQHGGLRPYCGTFLVFADYMRGALRLGALMKTPGLFIFTHDSIGVGEDGPTHQPVEHAMSLRMIPNLTVFRPADANESVAAWRAALERTDGPTAMLFSRQKLPILDASDVAGAARGGYVLHDCEEQPKAILIATGSEVSLALAAEEQLRTMGIATRVVSLPSWEVFEAQDQAYRDQVLPPQVTARVSVEVGVTMGWERYVGTHGATIGLDRFGASAPGNVVFEKLGFTVERVVETVTELL